MKTRSRWTRPQGRDRERAHQRVATGVRIPPVRMIVWSVAPVSMQHVGDPDGVGDDGQARDVGERAGRGHRWSCRPRSPWPCRGSTRAAAASAMASFSSCWSADLVAKPGSKSAFPAAAVAPPWTFSSEAALVEQLEVAPDRHVRHAELAHEVRHPDATVVADPFQDVVPGADGPARRLHSPKRAHATTLVSRKIAHKSTESSTIFHQSALPILDMRPRGRQQSVRTCGFLLGQEVRSSWRRRRMAES